MTGGCTLDGGGGTHDSDICVLALFFLPTKSASMPVLKPIATFSLYRQRACGRQMRSQVRERHRYMDHEY